jgi:hypothetical protein
MLKRKRVAEKENHHYLLLHLHKAKLNFHV